MDIALIYTPTAEDADEALRAANDLAEGLGSEGENISVLGPVESDGKSWVGSTATIETVEELQAVLEAILPGAQVEQDTRASTSSTPAFVRHGSPPQIPGAGTVNGLPRFGPLCVRAYLLDYPRSAAMLANAVCIISDVSRTAQMVILLLGPAPTPPPDGTRL